MTFIIWSAVLVTVLLLFAISLPVRYQHLATSVDARPLDQLDLSAASYATYIVTLDVMVALAHILIGSVIFLRKPNDRMAVFVSLTLIINGCILPLTELANAAGVNPGVALVDRFIIYLGMVSSIVLLYVFPDGKFVPRLTSFLSFIWAFLMLVGIVSRSAGLGFGGWSATIQFAVVIIFAGTGFYAQVYRYRNVSRPIQRQQTKWAMLGLAAACIGPVLVVANVLPGSSGPEVPNVLYQRVGGGFFTTSFLLGLLAATFFKLSSLLFPLSFAIAILRYRLWDIDILIRRTLVYGLLTGTLLIVYLIGIVLTQAILGLFAPSSSLSLVLSTLGTIALFNPLRRRIQSGIDRRFYRSRYDVEQIFEAFTKRMRDQVDPDQITAQLLGVLEGTLQPDHASLWLKPDLGKWKVTEKLG
ncbi:MAG: hypothetical protein A2Z16_01420 [Chloroflexi bacterium RBG_16_54_18]|nr:MAG: hypothetical protein A2Z16_01420 [Chloroflexi bacterium RBG_16_54_18]